MVVVVALEVIESGESSLGATRARASSFSESVDDDHVRSILHLFIYPTKYTHHFIIQHHHHSTFSLLFAVIKSHRNDILEEWVGSSLRIDF